MAPDLPEECLGFMASFPAVELATRLRGVSQSLSMGIVLVAVLALLGRLGEFALPPLTQPITVTVGSAWLFLAAGLSLWFRDLGSNGRWRRPSAIAATLVVALALIALTSDDRWPLDYEYLPWNAAQRLPTASGAAFLVLGLSLLLIDWELRSGFRPAQILSFGVVLVSLTVLFGYLYGVPRLYASDSRGPIPIQETILLFLTGTAVLCARPDRGLFQVVTSETAGGVMARATLGAVLVVPSVLGWLTLSGHRLGWYEAAAGTALLVLEFMAFSFVIILRVAQSLDAADRLRSQAEGQLRQRSLQRAGVAELGQRALSGAEPQDVKEEAVRLLVGSLSAGWGEFLELQADGTTLSPTLGPDVGARVSERGAVACRALMSSRPVLIHQLPGDHRVQDARLEAHGVSSAAVVAVRGASRTHGVLAVYSDRQRAFTDEDGHLLQTVASMLAAADDRRRSDRALRLSEAKFSGLFRSTPDAIALIRLADRHVIDLNDGLLQMTGLLAEDVVEHSFDRLGLWVDPDQSADVLNVPVRNVEVQFRTKSGKRCVGLCSTELVTLEGDQAVLAVIRDISDRKQEQDAIEQTNVKLGRLVEDLEARSREISLLNELAELLHACLTPTEACAVTTRFAAQLLPGTSGALCLFADAASLLEPIAAWGQAGDAMFSSQDCWALRRGRSHVIADEANTRLVCPHISQSARAPYLCVPMLALGEPLGILHVHGHPAQETDLPIQTANVQRLVEAVAEAAALALANLRLRDRLRRQSIRDQLTGLFNRWFLEEALERELLKARRSKDRLGMILMDLDGFKGVNDTCGHDAGDELLRTLGPLFRTRLRASDFACRYGGDEFLLILPGTTLLDTQTRAEEIRSAVRSATVTYRGRVIGPVAVSSGVVAFPDHGATVGELLQAADDAMYRAKSAGGDRIEAGPTRP
jgi:diguanylate cyclase (GGDEF)-like protein/PAS domain S-box-containing protein